MSDTQKPLENGLTYADAGVDIDAGEMLVEHIKPLAKSCLLYTSDAADE